MGRSGEHKPRSRLHERDRRKGEIWFAVADHRLPAAVARYEKGYLQRRLGEHAEWRLSDKGLTALRLDTLRSGQSPN